MKKQERMVLTCDEGFVADTLRKIEEAERARDYYNRTHKNSNNYGFIAWVVGIDILDKFDKEEFDKYMK